MPARVKKAIYVFFPELPAVIVVIALTMVAANYLN